MIAIPVYVREEKNYELLKACLDSIGLQRVLLVINELSSDYEKSIYLDERNFDLHHRNFNSVAGAWNDAIEYAFKDDEDVLIICNQDIELPPLNELHELIRTEGIAAAKTKEGEPDFALFGIRPKWIKETFGTLRPFDECFEGAYFEDNDFKYQCKLKGIEIPTIELDFKHFGSSVVTLDLEAQKENEQRFRKNHIRYINKWGGIRNFETFKTPFHE